jgi:hypothetical protein
MCQHRLPFGVALLSGSILALAPAVAAADNYAVSAAGKDPRGLAVVGGEVRWTATGDSLWHIERAGKGYTLRVSTGKWKGRYLSYDPDGKDRELFLSEKPTAGSYWEVGTIDRSKPTRMWADSAAGTSTLERTTPRLRSLAGRRSARNRTRTGRGPPAGWSSPASPSTWSSPQLPREGTRGENSPRYPMRAPVPHQGGPGRARSF